MQKTTKLLKACLLLTALLSSVLLFAQPTFVPNQGQWEGSFLYKTDLNSGALFFEETGYTILLQNPELNDHYHHGENHSHDTSHSDEYASVAYRMKWLNANKDQLKTSAFSNHEFYHNYFIGNDPERWKSNVPVYKGISYENLYPGVKVNYYGDGDNLKYDIHLAANADPSKIAMAFEGAEKITIEEGKLIVQTALGPVSEYIPEAYQIIEGNKIAINCNYTLTGTTAGFSLSDYNPQFPVVIDPVLVFSSFSGSTSDNWGFTATYDNDGNFYGGGIVDGSGYPATTGSFQQSFGGAFDAAISKFSSDGKNLLYATYIGGSSIDMPHSMIVDDNNDLVILGSTGSTDFPMSSSGYQSSFSLGNSVNWEPWNQPYDNGANSFVIRLSSNGNTMLNGTFLGSSHGAVGTNTEIVKNYCDETRGEVIVLNNGNIAITTSSTADDLPFLKPGSGPGTNSQNAIVAVFNPSLTQLVWGSYYGGTNDETGNSIKTDGTDIYVCGATESSNLPMHTTAFQSSYSGALDGYIAKFNGSNGQFLGATYIGTSSYDQAFFIDLDKFGSVFVFGQSQGSMPVTNGQYANSGSQQFLQKYTQDLSSRTWATVIGSSQPKIDIVPTAFMVDQCLNIYLSGWGGNINTTKPSYLGGSTFGLPVSRDAIDSTTDGSDFYFMVLDRDATGFLHGTFYGGNAREHVDGGTSRFSPDGVIYQAVCAACNSLNFPTTPGVYGPSRNGPNCNLGAIKIDMRPTIKAIPQINYQATDTTCDQLTVQFINNSQHGNKYFWDFGNGDTSNQFEPSATFDGVGTYTITLVAIDTVCDISDTATLQLTHNALKGPTASIAAEYTGCDTSFTVDFKNTSAEVNQFNWYFGDGSTSNQENPTHSFADSGTYQVMLIAFDTACFIADTVYTTITFSDSTIAPIVDLAYKDCSSGEVEVTHYQYRERYIYRWQYDGKKTTGAYPAIKFEKPGIYFVDLDIEDPLCNQSYKSDYQVMIESIKKETHIPNAFSPNGDNINEEFLVTGDHCQGLDYFRIFNRWGQIVFETDQPFTEFWDGTHKGRPAKEDVYTYILKSGNESKRGYLTLFR